MAGKGKGGRGGTTIILRREEGEGGGHHGGAWKVAYADFVTAMMAFFLLMWLLNATSDDQRRGLADYFAPSNVLGRGNTGSGEPFGGTTPNSDGAMVSDNGAIRVEQGRAPARLDIDDDGSSDAPPEFAAPTPPQPPGEAPPVSASESVAIAAMSPPATGAEALGDAALRTELAKRVTTADYTAIATLCRPVWAAGEAVWAAMAQGAHGPPPELAKAALGAVAADGPGPMTVVLASLLQRASEPGRVAQLAAGLQPAARAVAVEALEAMLEQPPPPFGSLDPDAATDMALATAKRLDDLDACTLLGGDRRRLVQAFRRAADEACRAGFLAATERQLLAPALKLFAAPVVEDAEVEALEAGARKLRALEAAGRKLGGAPAYDRALRDLTLGLSRIGAQTAHPDGLRPIDLARSIEILAGPDAAAAALGTALPGSA